MPKSDFLIDISRSVSRAGSGPATGIDRVERAYIDHALNLEGDHKFISRALGGFALLDKAGMTEFLTYLDGDADWENPDLLSRLGLRQPKQQQQAEATLRRSSIALSPKITLSHVLSRHLRGGFWYLNVGHTNQAGTVLSQIRQAGASGLAIMLHDTIPLSHPQTTRPGTPAKFARQLEGALNHADLMICNSQDTAIHLARFQADRGTDVKSVVCPLGIDPVDVVHRPSPTPEFVALGTLEPRKNHMLLLDVWEALAKSGTPPKLHIVGRRGWNNEAFFTRLDASPLKNRSMVEHSDLPDSELWPLIAKSRALLFPTLAEGYGLPLLEALQIGTPALASDLPVFRELAGDVPTYLSPKSPEEWVAAIRELVDSPRSIAGFDAPRWPAHFALLHETLEQAECFKLTAEGRI